ncbi:MAG: hypothetical protein AB7I41_06645 [Candidatus Sericytochromatia bacterium]
MSYLLPVLLGGLAVFLCVAGFFLFKKRLFLNHSFALVLLIQAVILGLFPVLNSPNVIAPSKLDLYWYQGGNLHRATWADWQKATIQNRLATATDYLKKLREQGIFVARIRGLDEYRPWAAALVDCMEWKYAQENGPQPEAMARACLSQHKIERFFKP